MDRPSFSIVIPTFQRREVVCEAVRAAGRIEYGGAVEVVVVVDGSADGTAEALKRLDSPFPLRVIEQDNAGAGAARNRGAAAAREDVLLFIDDDIVVAPDILVQYAAVFAAGADAACGDIVLEGGSVPDYIGDGLARWFAARSLKLQQGGPVSPLDVLTGNLAVKRRVFHEIGGFDVRYTERGGYGCEDVDLGVRLADGYDLRPCPGARAEQSLRLEPRQIMARSFRAAASELRFARKHPALGRENFRTRGAALPRTRFLVRPVAKLPFIAGSLAGIAVWLAEIRKQLPAWAKPAAAGLFWKANNLAYWAGLDRAGGLPNSSSVLVLCYHAIADLEGDPVLSGYGVARREFERQVSDLLARGFNFISPSEFGAFLAVEARVPRGAVLLTFDDCYAELPGVAQDVLAPRGIPAIAFAVTATASGSNEWDQAKGARRLKLVDGDGLRALQRNGVEIGCHSATHGPLVDVAPERLRAETSGAAASIEALGLQRPRFFAYPYGEFDGAARAAVAAPGFVAAFGVEARRVTPATDRYALPRVQILARHSGWRFRFRTAFPRLSEAAEQGQLHRRAWSFFKRCVRRLVG